MQIDDEIKFIFCPFETFSDKVGSFEVNLSTGEYYCHNCHTYGNINQLDDDTRESIEFNKDMED